MNKIFLKICNYVRYYDLVDGNITVLEQYISKVALMSQNIYGTPVFFNFSLVQNYIMSYFHCNTIFEVYRRLKIFISWLPLMYSRRWNVITRRYTVLHIYIYRCLWLMEPPTIWMNKKFKLISDYILSAYFLHVLVSTVSVIWYQSFCICCEYLLNLT